MKIHINGIYYNLDFSQKTAEVTPNPYKYSGKVTIPESVFFKNYNYNVTSIGEAAFSSCSGLTSVTIPNSVKSIGNGAFANCSALTSVTIGNSVKSIGENAFYGCSGLKKVIVPDIAAWCSIAFGSGNTNPLCYAKHLYSDETTEITNLIIPNSVKSIGMEAFYNCDGLTSVTIPNSVTSIGRCAFIGCSGLTSVTIPNSVKSIGDYAFSGCSGLTSVTIPNSVTSIGREAFFYCSGLTSVTIPNSVTSIGMETFYKCFGLTSVTIPNSVTSIGMGAFAYCYGLTSVTIPNSVKSIESSAFSDCYGLTSVTIPNSVTSIGEYVFKYCSGLTSVTIPNSVKSIGMEAFYKCSGLTSVTIPNSVKSIGDDAFYYCSGLTSITIPNSVKSIGRAAFSGCSGLTSVIIPNSVTSIGECAFYDCSGLISVNIGNGVESIEYGAFAECAELTDVYCHAEKVPTTQSNAFYCSYIEYATLHVPAVSIEQYKAKAPWGNFGTIVATDGTTPEPPTPEKCATPTISYSKGELTFSCDTEGAEYVYEITDTDIKKGCAAKVSLTVTYHISVYATKANYENSDTIQATLCWIEQQPQTEGITDEDAIAEVQAVPVLIQTQGNTITVEGAEAGTEIILYGANGVQLDSVIATTGVASLSTSRLSGSVAIVKIGNKTVKVLIKQ